MFVLFPELFWNTFAKFIRKKTAAQRFRKEKQLWNHKIIRLLFVLNRWRCSHIPDHNETHRHNRVFDIWNANTMQILPLLFFIHKCQQERTAKALLLSMKQTSPYWMTFVRFINSKTQNLQKHKAVWICHPHFVQELLRWRKRWKPLRRPLTVDFSFLWR